METDIRMMIEGLRPVSEFRSAVVRTIEALTRRIEDIVIVDEEDRAERTELEDLTHFWGRVLEGMGE